MRIDEAGLEDAAILLMSLGEEEAAAVFRHLSPREVQSLGETIARMTSVPKERLDKRARQVREHRGEPQQPRRRHRQLRQERAEEGARRGQGQPPDRPHPAERRCLGNRRAEVDGRGVDRRDAAPRAPADRRRRPRPPRRRAGGRGAEELLRAAEERGDRSHRDARRHPAVGAQGPERGDGQDGRRRRAGAHGAARRRQDRGRDDQPDRHDHRDGGDRLHPRDRQRPRAVDHGQPLHLRRPRPRRRQAACRRC